jgi:L-ascorbate metabolism protein UlaG (beta-lactamase superfamily)
MTPLGLKALILCFALTLSYHSVMSQSANIVIIEYYGHSCFLLTLNNGAKILIDPFDTTRIPYTLPTGSVEVVLSTHDHLDHNAIDAVDTKLALKANGREPIFAQAIGEAPVQPDGTILVDLKGATLKCATVVSFHDNQQGAKRGFNGILRLTIEGLNIVHLGDMGDTLNTEQIAKLQPVDVLMIPVGGFYTIDASQAQVVVEQLKPRLIIPMHFKTTALPEEFPITTVDAFLEGYPVIHRHSNSVITLSANKLPKTQSIEVMRYHGQK